MTRATPAIPLFGDAYLADTRHLSLEEHGAYLQLLMIAWRVDGCRLPDDDTRLARMLGVTSKKWAKLKPVVMAFWTLENDAWTQKRLSKERRFVAKKSEDNRDAANARWNAKSLKTNGAANANAMPNGCMIDAPPPPPIKKEDTLAKAKAVSDADFWADAKAFLSKSGKTNPGALIQKWLREQGKELTLGAIAAAQLERAVDPVAYVTGYFRRNGRPPALTGYAVGHSGVPL